MNRFLVNIFGKTETFFFLFADLDTSRKGASILYIIAHNLITILKFCIISIFVLSVQIFVSKKKNEYEYLVFEYSYLYPSVIHFFNLSKNIWTIYIKCTTVTIWANFVSELVVYALCWRFLWIPRLFLSLVGKKIRKFVY